MLRIVHNVASVWVCTFLAIPMTRILLVKRISKKHAEFHLLVTSLRKLDKIGQLNISLFSHFFLKNYDHD